MMTSGRIRVASVLIALLPLGGAEAWAQSAPAPSSTAAAVRAATPAAVPTLDAADRLLIARLTELTGQAFTAVACEGYLLLKPQDAAARIDRTRAALAATRVAFDDAFGLDDRPAGAPMVWLIFSSRAAYNAYALDADGRDMDWTQAYYSARTNRVAFLDEPGESDEPVDPVAPADAAASVDRRLAHLTHEASHQLAFNSGLQRRGVMYPLWASEGLATNFEIDALGGVGPDRANAHRLARLAEADRGGRLIPVDRLISMTRVPAASQQAMSDLYAQSWAFFRFLHDEHRPSLMAYYAAAARGPLGARPADDLAAQFTDAFGPIDRVVAGWDAYRRRLIDDAAATDASTTHDAAATNAPSDE